ncbi:hypothetical protein [Enterococcus rivorum]|uniref:hypothetical protein n=1 Tax=Enterococcus rivorum TaxID=762845 RepID=UPI00147087B2|nr:hypothetical protein [Enterococcus rivorum]MBP2100555.1 hypothetical protein [Enterococcus rivorum]
MTNQEQFLTYQGTKDELQIKDTVISGATFTMKANEVEVVGSAAINERGLVF